jgi:RNA polymerase-interacting CarD/CdnL/TRCF family regulator
VPCTENVADSTEKIRGIIKPDASPFVGLALFLIFPQLIQEILMNIQEGDSVMHWTHGLGKVVQLEERELSGQASLYYAVQIGDMTVWVPADDMLESRLRFPTSTAEFERLMGSLSHPGEALPSDRRERKTLLMEWLKDGETESLFRVICSLSTYQQDHSLNYDEQTLLKRTKNALVGEWGYAMSVTPAEAETELSRRLIPDVLAV